MQSDTNSGLRGLSTDTQVSRGLNLTLELANPKVMPLLLAGIKAKNAQTRKALEELHFVHFARFLPVRGNHALMVITEFDGPLRAYVLDFVIAIGDVFDLILKYVKDAPTLPVREHPREFMQFVEKNNRVVVCAGVDFGEEYPLYSAYPDSTVIDIIGPRRGPAPALKAPAPADIPLADVQGNILHGYHAARARHYALRLPDAGIARAFLALLVGGNDKLLPQVSTAERWERKPLYRLNVGITAAGLKGVGVPEKLRELMPTAFLEGPVSRAAGNGDTGPSSPLHWSLGGPAQRVDLLVSLYAFAGQDSLEEFETRDLQLQGWWKRHGVQLVHWHDAEALSDDRVHFGYREGFSQPRIAGVEDQAGVDLQPLSSAGEFLLGDYTSIYGGKSLDELPAGVCRNGIFAAVRLIEQDVAAFEKMLDDAVRLTGMQREHIAAKLMGRWRNGTPVTTQPDPPKAALMPARVHAVNYNAFDYAPSNAHPDWPNDHGGLHCPVGAHIRRMNPRSALVAGSPYSRRLIRRGMPYGPAWDAKDPDRKRGLYGLFLCADLERQFEFLVREWGIGDTAASGIRGTRDPVVGSQQDGGEFLLPVDGREPYRIQVPRLVTTRGSLYVLMPGLEALRFLARGEGFVQEDLSQEPQPLTVNVRAAGAVLHFRPEGFDPKDPAFLADPYPFYAQFRQHAPVALVRHRDYRSYWVFSHALVTQVCEDTKRFLKRPAGEKGDRGLFFMDPPRHTEVRKAMDTLFEAASRPVPTAAAEESSLALADILAADDLFDLVPEYSNRVTRNAFMRMFGIPPAQWESAGKSIDTILEHFDQMLPEPQRAPAKLAGLKLLFLFQSLRSRCPAHGAADLLCRMDEAARTGVLEGREVNLTALHFALGGYLSTDFLVGTAVHNLLSRPALLRQYLDAGKAGRRRALEELKRFDAPFQMADRFAAEETLLGGVTIPAGAMVTVVYGSANRDPAVFGSTADELDLGRNIAPGTNYVFGHGVHHCIGAGMADDMAPAAIDTLLDGLPKLSLTSKEPRRYQDPYYRAFSFLQLHR